MRTMLVVDDEKTVRDSLRFLLEREGYKVLVARDGIEAITMAAQQPVDAAMVDVHMPVMNGIEICRALHAQAKQAGRTVAVWMMSGARTAQAIRASTEAGAMDLLGKPFDYKLLLQRFDAHFAAGPDARG
ncbi:MAG: response regulator [Opitutaceae bacterium]